MQDKGQASEGASKTGTVSVARIIACQNTSLFRGYDSMGLMVILDDSVVMARKTKPWTPSRSQAAESFVAKLTGYLTPGSRIAVRDFLCKQSNGGKKQKETTCLSHMLYEWADSPFPGLKEKLARVSAGGHNNPCAALRMP